jgi:hypothetical protein
MHGHHESLDSTRPELQRVATAADFTGRGRSNFLASPGLAGAVFSPSSSTSAKDEATRERLVSNRAFGWSGSGSGVDLRDPNGCCTSVTGHSKVEGGGLDPARSGSWANCPKAVSARVHGHSWGMSQSGRHRPISSASPSRHTASSFPLAVMMTKSAGNSDFP